ncbi:probable rotatin at C-terminar half [Coccomyxa sp. Obi]|nr:probable rotatin at C-terminar half [Coccomyxa sp. Obi]
MGIQLGLTQPRSKQEPAVRQEAGCGLAALTGSTPFEGPSGGPKAGNTAGSISLKCQAPCSTSNDEQVQSAEQRSAVLPDQHAPSLVSASKEHGRLMQISRSFTSIAAGQPPSQGDPEHEALSVLRSTLTQSNHIAVSLQTVQELHDRILDMPLEVLKEHCQLMPDLDTMLKHAKGGGPLQIAISSAIRALAGRLSSASLPAIDRQLGSTSTSTEPCRTQPSNEVMAEASERLASVKSASDHASCLSALQGLHRLVTNPEGACAVAQADWLGAFEHLLSACPATREDRLLWLSFFHILQLLVATQQVSEDQLVALGCKYGPLVVPMLDRSAQVASIQPDLPHSLSRRTMNPYTRAIFTAAQDAAEQTLLTGVVLEFLAKLLHKAHTLSDSTVCTNMLVALEANSLLHALVSLYVTSDAASYGCRLRAMLVLKCLVRCVGDTWRFAWDHPGTEWDDQVAACLGPIISHVCYTWQKRQPASSMGKAMLRQALQCLTQITRSLPASLWAPAWRQEGGTYWLTNLARRDPEWQVRACALELLSRLASPAAPATSCMLSLAWRDGPAIAAQMARNVGEAKPVQAAALAFLTATLAARSANVHQSLGTAPIRMPAAADRNSGCPASNAVHENTSKCADSMQHKLCGDAHAFASTSDTSCRVASSSDSHGQNLAWHHDQQIWEFLPVLLKDGLEDPCMARALSGLLLQASLANAQALHECICQAACWPDLLQIFSSARAQSRPASRNLRSLDAPTSTAMSDEPQPWQNTAALWADSASNLAQLIIVLLQSLPAAAVALTSSGAPLTALLHCYGGAADAMSCSDWDLHSRLMAMQQHVALAVAALCPRVELAGKDQIEVLRHESGVAVSAALLLLSDPSHVPLQTKMGTCHLLAALLTSREATVTFLSDSSGEELRHPGSGVPVGASLCKSLAGLWSSCPAPAQETASTAPQRSTVAAALCSVLAFSRSAKEAAVETGLLLSLMATAEEARDVMASRGHSAPAQHQLQQKSIGAAPSTRTALSNLSNLCRARAAHRAQQSGADCGPRYIAGVDQHKARHQLHWALLLLQHLMLDSAMAQAAAADAGGMILIIKLWNVAVDDLEVMQDLLEVLKHMVADSASAQKTFCLQGMPERILALLSGPKPQAATWTPLWAVLRNMAALSHETSALLKHAPLLPQVLQIAHELAQRKQLSKLSPVLAVLGNIAAHTQGQRALLATPAASGVLDLLISLTQVNHMQTNAAAMLVLHALAHAPDAAIYFLAHPSALPCLVTCLGKADVDKDCAAYAASGLWALTYNCQKVKGVLRKIGTLDVALAQVKEAFRNVDERGELCSDVHGTKKLAYLNALGHRAVTELIQSVHRS